MNPVEPRNRENEQPLAGAESPRVKSMHDDVEVWEDCCVCEPEPRWQALAEELERES